MNSTLRKILLSLLSFALLPPALLAQSDIFVTQIGPKRTLVRNRSWTTGVGNAANNYIFTPAWPWETITVFIINTGPSGNVGGSMSAWEAGDPSTTTFAGCTTTGALACSWFQVGSTQTFGPDAPGPVAQESFSLGGAAVATVNFLPTAGESSTNVSIFLVEAQQTAMVSSGGGAVVASGSFTAQSGNIASTALYTPATAGLYLVSFNVIQAGCSDGCSTGYTGSVQAEFAYTDAVYSYAAATVWGGETWCGVGLQPGNPNSCGWGSFDWELYLSASNPLNFSTVYSSAPAGATYDVFWQVSKA